MTTGPETITNSDGSQSMLSDITGGYVPVQKAPVVTPTTTPAAPVTTGSTASAPGSGLNGTTPAPYKTPASNPSSSASSVINGNINAATGATLPNTQQETINGVTYTISTKDGTIMSGPSSAPTGYSVGSVLPGWTGASGSTGSGTSTTATTTDQYGNNISGPASSQEQAVMDNTGMTLAQVRSSFNGPDGGANMASYLAAHQATQTAYDTGTAAENASWAAIQAQLAQNQASSVEMAKVSAAKAGALGTTATQGVSAINTLYTLATAQAQAQHTQALAKLAQGDATGAAQDLKDMQTTIQTAQTAAANIANQQATQQLNIDTKNQTLADNQLKTLTEQTATAISALPDDTSTFTSAQMATLTGTPGYNDLINAGYTPNDALGYIKNAATSNAAQIAQEKVQNQSNSLALQTQKLQVQLAEFNLTHAQTAANQAGIAAFTTVPNGSAYASALTAIQAAGIKDTPDSQGMTNAGNIGNALANNDTATAKQAIVNQALQVAKTQDPASVKIYTGINTINQYMGTVATLINQLPTGLQPGLKNGTIQNIYTWAGQNKTGNNSTIAAEIKDAINHATILYATEIASSRPSGQLMDAIKSTLPNYTDTNALNTASINAMSSLTDSINSSVIGGAIGADNYTAIFGTIATANTTTNGSQVNWTDTNGKSYPVGSTWTVNGKTVTITPTGPQYTATGYVSPTSISYTSGI